MIPVRSSLLKNNKFDNLNLSSLRKDCLNDNPFFLSIKKTNRDRVNIFAIRIQLIKYIFNNLNISSKIIDTIKKVCYNLTLDI